MLSGGGEDGDGTSGPRGDTKQEWSFQHLVCRPELRTAEAICRAAPVYSQANAKWREPVTLVAVCSAPCLAFAPERAPRDRLRGTAPWNCLCTTVQSPRSCPPWRSRSELRGLRPSWPPTQSASAPSPRCEAGPLLSTRRGSGGRRRRGGGGAKRGRSW